METDIDKQYKEYGKVVDQLKEAGFTDETLLRRIDDGFLEFIFCGQKIIPPTFRVEYGLPTFRWDLENGFIEVKFCTTTTDWYYEAELKLHVHESSFPIVKYSYKGKENWSFESQQGYTCYGYCLPDEIEKHFTLPDDFSKEYKPRLDEMNYHKPKIIWSTSYWDGPLAGYCQYKDQLCYFDLAEETDFERHRMYAVYELSTFEQADAWFKHYKWTSKVYSRPRWALHVFWWRLKNKLLGYKPHDPKKEEQFRSTHKLIGYFKG